MTPGTADHIDQPETRERLAEAEEMLRAIRQGEIDALVVEGAGGIQVYTLHSADEPYRNLVEQMQEGSFSNSAATSCIQHALRGAGGRQPRPHGHSFRSVRGRVRQTQFAESPPLAAAAPRSG
jgi:hypothetical protein